MAEPPWSESGLYLLIDDLTGYAGLLTFQNGITISMDQHKWGQGMVSLLQEPPDKSLLPFDGLGSRGNGEQPFPPQHTQRGF